VPSFQLYSLTATGVSISLFPFGSRHYAHLLCADAFGFYLLDSDFRGFASEKMYRYVRTKTKRERRPGSDCAESTFPPLPLYRMESTGT
jgi:hypothetical protein